MSEGIDAKVIEQLRKLLNLSTAKGATESEASNAVELAQKLALKHGLDLQKISVQVEGETYVPKQGESAIFKTGNSIEWKVKLVDALVYANGCYSFWNHKEFNTSNKKRMTTIKELVIVGTELNRIVVTESFKYLESVVEELAEEELLDTQRRIRIKEIFMPQGLNKREFLSSFRVGCAERLAERV
jgi:hypothetical protein